MSDTKDVLASDSKESLMSVVSTTEVAATSSANTKTDAIDNSNRAFLVCSFHLVGRFGIFAFEHHKPT